MIIESDFLVDTTFTNADISISMWFLCVVLYVQTNDMFPLFESDALLGIYIKEKPSMVSYVDKYGLFKR